MTTHASGAFELKSFDEDTTEEFEDGTKLTRARIVQSLSGDLEGDLTVDFFMYYRADGTASFAGYERFVGRLGDRSGSFVQQAIGTYDNTQATTTSFVVPGSGTGDLAELSGEGTTAAPHGSTGTYTLDYHLG
jgi:hypothetical protein